LAKLMVNISKYVDEEKKPKNLKFVRMLAGAVSGSNYHGLAEFHMNSLFLGMMHFQDPFNWDIDRIHKCDIHYATPDGRVLPFCTFNVIPELYRDRVQRKFSIPASEWETKTGKNLNEDKHHRKFSKEEIQKIVGNFNQYRKSFTKVTPESDWGEEASESMPDSFVPLVSIGVPQKKQKPTMEHPAAGGCASCG
ncbi:MAG: hypothetical protein QMD85_02930, partial [Candidatus Aenigmarchaeota archaeon]|nr:hypothetical protein [Candidatus Aenigmarchaeota archaeon]MDI6722500.1 hypothetical protein [Candidatus Aenigmarchaeota archaeon]